jgi:hypothetical protein
MAPGVACAPDLVVLVVNMGGSCFQSALAPWSAGEVSSSSWPPGAHGLFLRSAFAVGPNWLVPLQPSVDHAEYHLPSVSFHGRTGS